MKTDREWATDVALFLVITFGVTWVIAASSMFFHGWFERNLGLLNKTSFVFYVAVWAPNLAALTLTLIRGGKAELIDLFARLLRWRVSLWIWLAAIGFHPALMIIVQLVGFALGRPMLGVGIWPEVLATLINLPLLALGPLGEELGWRGYLLPRILERWSPAISGLIVGAIWMLWHVPAFLISGLPQSNMSFPIFVVGGIAFSVFVTWLFVNARQSILISGIIPHAIANAYGDATGAMTWINAAVLAVGALLLVTVRGTSLRWIKSS